LTELQLLVFQMFAVIGHWGWGWSRQVIEEDKHKIIL
jgi:hypothetical protein